MTSLSPKTITMVGYARCATATAGPSNDPSITGTGNVSSAPVAKWAYPATPDQNLQPNFETSPDFVPPPATSEIGIEDAPPSTDAGTVSDGIEAPLSKTTGNSGVVSDNLVVANGLPPFVDTDNKAPLPSDVVTPTQASYVRPTVPARGGALVELVERTGTSGDLPSNYLNLLAADVSSMAYSDPLLESSVLPLQVPSTGITYSYERWFRFRFTPPFNAVQLFRFFCPNYTPSDGWTVLFGTTTSFQTPVSTASTIAVNPLPLVDPAPSQNCGGITALDGTQVRYSDWIVVQAQVDPSAAAGPIQGYEGDAAPYPLDYRFSWLEL